MSRHSDPFVLEGRLVRLEPMSLDHLDGLAEVGLDPELWRWTVARPTDRDGLRVWIETAIANRAAGGEQPWVIVERTSGRPVGGSRYLNIVPEHRRLEIGWTWVAPGWQRTGVNRKTKFLMLERAFASLGCVRVEFKTDSRNERSRTALLGIGATFEGIFRKHMVMPDSGFRDSAYFSIIDDDWPAVRSRLLASISGSSPP
jgi:RimJ/RimL family protein N-acetyltransferase